MLLYAEGEERRAAYGGHVVRKGVATAEVDKVLESGGKLPLPELLRCRVRYFTDGMAIGGKAFVERVFNDNRGLFGPKRREGARKMRFGEWGGAADGPRAEGGCGVPADHDMTRKARLGTTFPLRIRCTIAALKRLLFRSGMR